MYKTYLAILCLTGLLILGCSQTLPAAKPGDRPESTFEFGQKLQERAVSLASSELARLNAVELLYRNIPMRHQIQNPAIFRIDQGWTKVYRRFSGFEVKDIRRSDSLLAPIIFDIDYEYEAFGTVFRKESDGAALEETKTDVIYESIYSDIIRVEYSCDDKGNLLNSQKEYMPRPKYFLLDELDEIIVGPETPQSTQ